MEDNSLALGGQRFRRRVQEAETAGKGSTVGAARKLLQVAIEPLEAAIQYMIDNSKRAGQAKRGGRSHEAVRWCKAVGADVAAYITVKTVLNGVRDTAGLRRLSVRDGSLEIVSLILDELRYRRFQEKAPGLFNYRMGKFTNSSYAHMARSMNATMKYAEIDWKDIDMAPQKRILVGAKLIDLFVQTSGLVEVIRKTTSKQKAKSGRVTNELFISPTQDTVQWLTKRNDCLEFMSPVAMPMVTPPLSWSPGVKGGYRFAMRNKFALLRKASAEHQRTVAGSEMPLVYGALNRIQNTAWKINTDVVALVEAIQRRGGAMAGIPAFEDEPNAPKPFDIDTNEVSRKAYRRKQHAVKERNHLRGMLAVESKNILSAASGVSTELAIYFPHNLDFRGRVYPLCSYLSPQGGDLSRGLLTFADTKAVGSEGGRWLAIHGANCLGSTGDGEKISAMSFADRAAWIVRHSNDICSVADDPFSFSWWTEADKPLQFYAFCKEWQRYVADGSRESFVSGLPIAQDGSCNGLQHFSALLRDEIGGRAVNLVPMDTPQDIYQIIADKVLDKLELLAGTNWLAAKWLSSGLVTRKLTKRPTMTFGYGSKKFGFRNQIGTYLAGLENWQEIKVLFANDQEQGMVGDAALLLSELIWDSLRETVVAAADAMVWMQAAVRKVITHGKPVFWIVPATNLHVRQEYFVDKSKQINTILSGRVIKPRVYEKTDKIKIHKQANAVAPNVVHSLDAAALMLTVTSAASEGVEAFGMVHDSYATVAGDCSILAAVTRRSFVRLYTDHNVIGSLYEQFKAQMEKPEDCPAPPLLGNLDVGAVLASDYFFA